MKKCSSCKMNNPDEAKFCRKCGKPLGKASSPFIKKFKDKRVIVSGTVLALALCGGAGIALYNNTPERLYQKNIAMAEKYLEEYNYTKAEEYLNIAKSIDPKKEEAYTSLVTVYEAQGEIAQVDTVISEAKETLPISEQSTFLAQLESIKSSSSSETSSNESTSRTSSIPQSSTDTQVLENSSAIASKDGIVALADTPGVTSTERPIIDVQDLSYEDNMDGQSSVNSLNSINSEVDQKISKDVVPPTPTQETGDTNEDSIEVSIESDTKVVSPLPNTSYTIVAEIGSLDMTPIALNSDCWVIKKGNEFQFLFPDGSTKKLDSKDQLILQVNTDYTGNTTLLSSACLIESSSQDNNQYYPKEEEISSCLPSSSEKTSYSLEGNYQNNTVPVLVRSSNQSGYWIYNPASKALYGPFKDSEDTSFYSKVSRLSDITLVGHNGQIGGPYWTPMGSTVQKTTKNEKTQSLISDSKDTDSELISKESKALNNSKESTATNQKNTNMEELKIWSKDGTSYRTGYTNPKAVDWYTVGAFQADQFHLLDENLEIVYAGPFDQGGSVINSVAPVQINGVWKLVQFKNVPSSGPVTNYSFTNTDKEESNTSSNPSTSDQEKKSTDDVKSDSSTNTSSTLKVNTSEKSTTTQSTSKESTNYFLKDEDERSTSSNKTEANTTQGKEDEEVTLETSSTKSTISDTKSSSNSSASKKNTNYFLKDEETNNTSSGKTETNATKESDKTTSKNSSTQSVSNKTSNTTSTDKTETSSTTKEEVNYFDKSSKSTTDKTVTNNTSDKDNKSAITSDKSSNKVSTSETSKSSTSTATQKNKVTDSASTTKDADKTSDNKDDKDTSNEASTSIYYSFPEFAGTYTVTGVDWSNSFKLYDDGSFEGEYTEVSKTDDPELYPNGVINICSYSGTFSLKNNRLKITSLDLEETPGETEIEDGILYKYIGLSDSCMSQGEMFTLYGPGTPYSKFSSKASRWIPTPATSATVDFIMVQDGTSEYAYV